MAEGFLFFIGFFGVVVILHELGHYLAMLSLKLNPKIKYSFGMIQIEDNRMILLSVGKNLYCYYLGISFGLLPFMLLVVWDFSDFAFYALTYVIMCGSDIMQMIGLWQNARSVKEPAIIAYQRFVRKLQGQLDEASRLRLP